VSKNITAADISAYMAKASDKELCRLLISVRKAVARRVLEREQSALALTYELAREWGSRTRPDGSRRPTELVMRDAIHMILQPKLTSKGAAKRLAELDEQIQRSGGGTA
jgi:hypothetical protein